MFVKACRGEHGEGNFFFLLSFFFSYYARFSNEGKFFAIRGIAGFA
jgi:hypothetical protein